MINAALGNRLGTYVEPFFGSGAVLLTRPRSGVELVNDIDDELVRFYRVLRDPGTRNNLIEALTYTGYARSELEEARSVPLNSVPDPVERARRFMVLSNQSFVGSAVTGSWTSTLQPTSGHSNASKWGNYVERLSAVAERLREVQIECTDALGVIEKVFQAATSDIGMYLDPPYVMDSRNGSAYREDGFTKDHHERMLNRIRDLPGPVVLSGYSCEMYDAVLTAEYGWTRSEYNRAATSSSGRGAVARRVEVLWTNHACIRQPVWHLFDVS